MIKWALTTSKTEPVLDEDIKALALELHIPFLPRQNRGIQKILAENELEYLLVLENQELVAYAKAHQLAYHPGMAVPRLKLWEEGTTEVIFSALDLKEGESLLDGTMGLASDALIASAMVGETGIVTCLEKSPLIYAITAYGLKHWKKGSIALQAAMRRIQPMLADYHDFLPQVATNSYDVVYLDPMFLKPRTKSSGIACLREVADYYQPQGIDLLEACRIAQKRVVVKFAKGDMDTNQFDDVVQGRYSPIAFGILNSCNR